MRQHFAVVPVFGGEAEAEALNKFLASHRVVSLERQFIQEGPRSAWAVCVSWVDAGPKSTAAGAVVEGAKARVDYREVLTPPQFAAYAKLREARKRLAERDGVPAYAVMTNEQMAEMVQREMTTLAEVGRLDGVGPARLEKYGSALLEVLRTTRLDAPPPLGSPPTASV